MREVRAGGRLSTGSLKERGRERWVRVRGRVSASNFVSQLNSKRRSLGGRGGKGKS